MKRAVILHGTDANPQANWFPWLKAQLEAKDYKVWVPLLPGNHAPDRKVYNDFLLNSDWDFNNNLVIGHSSGAVSILNLLMDERCPKIKLGVMVSAWNHGTPPGMDYSQFANLFPKPGFDFNVIQQKAAELQFIHAADDPYCPLEQAEFLADYCDAPITILEQGGHLGSGFTELPAVWEIIKPQL